jgi:beta-1,4-mannosyl-glycoprotein beta-1,4-N-acetylglucosaminyltransferase
MTWTLGDPGAYLASDVQGLPRGSLPRVAGGGFHASSYCFPPAVILKEATATEYTGYEKYVGDLRVAMATAADARAGGLGDARGACAAAMQSIRSECLKPRLPERMRKVNELINSDGGLKETFKLPALLSGPDAFKRFPGWDPSGVAVDERAVDVPAGWDVVQRR